MVRFVAGLMAAMGTLLLAWVAPAAASPSTLQAAAAARGGGSSTLSLPPVFSDGLVLETWAEGDARSFMYGTATKGTAVNLTMTSEDPARPYEKTYYTAADVETGEWSVQLDGTYIRDPSGRPGPKFGPYKMTVRDAEGGERRIADVTYGTVYVCFGDLEMAKPLGQLPSAQLLNVTLEAARNFTTVRLFDAAEAGARWHGAANASALERFSALCYMTGRSMQQLYNPTGASPATPQNLSLSNITCPVGLISASGSDGQHLAAWAPNSATSACAGQPGANSSVAYRHYVQPLQHLAIRGGFWHGGSADAVATTAAGAGAQLQGQQYEKCFAASLQSWRDGGNIGDWSLAFTQLGNRINSSDAASWLAVQLAQQAARPHATPNLTSLTTTSMAPLLGLPTDLLTSLPALQEAGRRLALGMLHTAFSKMEPQLAWAAPEPAYVEASGSGTIVEVIANFSNGPVREVGTGCEAAFHLSTGEVGAGIEASAVRLRADGLSISATFSMDSELAKRSIAEVKWLLRYDGGNTCMFVGEKSRLPMPVFLVPVLRAKPQVLIYDQRLQDSARTVPKISPPPMVSCELP